MKSILLLTLLILATLHVQISTTFGKTIEKSSSTQSESESSSSTNIREDKTKQSETRVRRNSNSNDDYEDFLINQLSRENDIMTSNFLDTAVTCNK